MAWPPPTMRTDQTNALPLLDTHPADHAAVGAAINNDIVPKIDTMQGQIDANTSGWPAGDATIQADLDATQARYTIAGNDSIIRVPSGGTTSIESDNAIQSYNDSGGFVGYTFATDVGMQNANGDTSGTGATTIASWTWTPARPLIKVMLFGYARINNTAGYVELDFYVNSGANILGRGSVYGGTFNGTGSHAAVYEASVTPGVPITFYFQGFKSASTTSIDVSQSHVSFTYMH